MGAPFDRQVVEYFRPARGEVLAAAITRRAALLAEDAPAGRQRQVIVAQVTYLPRGVDYSAFVVFHVSEWGRAGE